MTNHETSLASLLVRSRLLPGFRTHGASVTRTESDGNEVAIFVQRLPWSRSETPEVIVAFGVRSERLKRFDTDVLGFPQGKWPRLGLLHYERSLGWLLGIAEPSFTGGPELAVEQMLPTLLASVIPHLGEHASDPAIADALYATQPLHSLPRHELLRLVALLEQQGDSHRLSVVAAALDHPSQGRLSAIQEKLIADTTAEIERSTGARAMSRQRRWPARRDPSSDI